MTFPSREQQIAPTLEALQENTAMGDTLFGSFMRRGAEELKLGQHHTSEVKGREKLVVVRRERERLRTSSTTLESTPKSLQQLFGATDWTSEKASCGPRQLNVLFPKKVNFFRYCLMYCSRIHFSLS